MTLSCKQARVINIVAIAAATAVISVGWTKREEVLSYIKVLLFSEPELTRDQTILILRDIAIRQYDTLHEISQTAARVQINLEQRGVKDMLSKQDLNALLISEETEALLAKYKALAVELVPGLTLGKFESYVNRSDDVEVTKFAACVDEMRLQALEGNIPMMPGNDIDYTEVSEAQSLNLIDRCLRAKRSRLAKIFSRPDLMDQCQNDPAGGFIPTPEIAELIRAECRQADLSAIKESRLFEGYGDDFALIAHKSVTGFHCRTSAAYRNARLSAIDRHTEQISALIANKGKYPLPSEALNAVLDPIKNVASSSAQEHEESGSSCMPLIAKEEDRPQEHEESGSSCMPLTAEDEESNPRDTPEEIPKLLCRAQGDIYDEEEVPIVSIDELDVALLQSGCEPVEQS